MRLSLFLLLLLFTHYSQAQYTFETYTPANGLVDARVSGMTQDKYGRLIIYTREGFSIYDGQRFTNYLTIDTEEIGIITGSMMLPDSSLYLIRFNGSPIKIDKHKVSYDRALLKNVIEVSTVKRVNDSINLIFTNLGVYLITNKNNKKLLNKSSAIPIELKNTNFGAILHNKLLLYINDGNSIRSLLLYDLLTEKVVDKIDNIILSNIVQDKEGTIYLINNSEIFSINKEKINDNKILYSNHSKFDALIKNRKGYMLDIDNSNNVWLFNNTSDCYKITTTTNEKTIDNYSTGLLKGITGVFQDRELNFWFLSHGKGIQKLVQSNYTELSSINGNPHTQNKFLHHLTDGSVFINGKEGKYSINGNRIITLQNAETRTNDELIYWQNNYWSFKNKSTLQNDKSSIIKFKFPDNEIPLSISSKIKTDHNGNLLIGGNVFYLLSTNGQAAAIELPYYTDNITADDEGNYWAFSRATSKIINYKYENSTLVKIKEYQSPLPAPRCVSHWNKDTFLVGTRNSGLVFLKINDNNITIASSLNRENGLSNNFILDLVKLNGNRIALATASGLNIVSFNNGDTSIQNVSSAINVYDPISNLIADKEGNLYAISETSGSIFKYTNNQISKSEYLPTAYFNNIFVNGTTINTQKNIFSFRENNFLIEVAATTYIDNRNTKFIFSIDGTEKKQIINTTGNLELNNLDPGTYYLSIKILYPGNLYPEQILQYSFTIKEPFWKTWWFSLTIIALLSFLTWFFVRNFYRRKLERTKAVLEKELAIEQERSRMARELHDGLGSMLSGVKHSFAAMSNQMSMNEGQQTIFHANIDKLNETIKELRTISHSMASESLLKFGLQSSLQDHCQQLNQTVPLKITFNALNMETVALTEDQTFHIFRIAQELLTNIIKHANASEAILQISYDNNRIYLTVEDNGTGFEINTINKKKGLGLKNIESRIKILNGKLDFKSSNTSGTSVFIEIPC